MKNKGITTALLISLLVFSIGCGADTDKYNTVKNGYLKAFGDEVTIGQAFEVVSGGAVNWEARELAPSEAEHTTHYLVEAKWVGSKEIAVQFVVKNDGSDFRLHGSLMGGEFVNAFTTVLAFKKAYNQKNPGS